MLKIANHQGNANQNHNITSHLSEWLSSKRTQITNVGEDVEKREPSYTVGENVDWCSHCKKTVWKFLKKLKIDLPYDPAIPLLGIYLKKTKTLIWKDTRTPTFITALFTIAKIWKQPKCPSTDEWMKKTNGLLLSHSKGTKFCHLQQHGWTWRALC